MYYHQNTDNIDACIALLLSPTNTFYELQNEKEKILGLQKLFILPITY